MKPMLAATLEHVSKVQFPVIASPKLDGIRSLVIQGQLQTRSLKLVPNLHCQKLFGSRQLEGLDGELIVGPPTAKDVYNQTTSGVMSRDGEPDARFWVFDYAAVKYPDGYEKFSKRLERVDDLVRRSKNKAVMKLPQITILNEDELDAFEVQCLGQGYEGVMLRDPNGLYKFGRSTVREGGLLKLKRFEDSEAYIIGAVEQLQNLNEAKVNALGYKERSSHKANKVGKGVLGAFKVRDLKTGVEFEIGTGFNDAQRRDFWANSLGGQLVGEVVKYKYQPVGVKDKPRFPVFIGFRDPRDM